MILQSTEGLVIQRAVYVETLYSRISECRKTKNSPSCANLLFRLCRSFLNFLNMMRKEIIKHSCGYLLLYRPDHKFCNNQGRVPEHRIIMEEKIGRIIDPRLEDVHHIDRNVENNKIDNLMLVTPFEHSRIHHGWKFIKGVWFKKCSCCKECIEANENNFLKRGNGTLISYCKKCVVRTRKLHPAIKDQVNYCKVCGKNFISFRRTKEKSPKHCSFKCSWVTRKKGGKSGHKRV